MQNASSALADTAREVRPGIDPGAREALIEQYMGLVHHAAARAAATGNGILDRDDLVSYGVIGLIEAIDRYDSERGVGFAGYALHRIRGAMLDAARSLDPLPRSVRRRVKQIDHARGVMTPSLGREPLARELCDAAGLTEREYWETMSVTARLAIPLEAVARGSDGDQDQASFAQPADPADEDFTDNVEMRELIDDLGEAISLLPQREKLVLALHFKEGLDLSEVARILDVSPSRISQLKARALERLRFSLRWHQAA